MNLSIIIPTYNRNSHLRECLKSLEHNEAEFIVVDDGSPVPVEGPPNIRLLRHDRNRGRAAAVNTGLSAASHDLVLIVDDDIFAAPDMVVRLAEEFAVRKNPKLALVGRVVWDPQVRKTLTMRWLDEAGPFHDISMDQSGLLSNLATGNTMMWKPFVLQHGGFDENFTHYGLEDVELGLRLKQDGLEIRLLASAVGYHHKQMWVRDLVHRELQEGLSAVYLHSKFPSYLPQVEDTDNLLSNASHENEASAAVEELSRLEQGDASIFSSRASDLFMTVYRYYFLTGILNGLKERGPVRASSWNSGTLSLYNQASHLVSAGDFDEARKMFRLVRSGQDSQYWAGAEYHMGCIEAATGEEEQARIHFMNCLVLNPNHLKAREGLKRPSVFRESQPNVYLRCESLPKPKILFVLFGGLDDVLSAFPVVAGLRDKYHASEIVWLTSAEFMSLAQASLADGVRKSEIKDVIIWDSVIAEGFTHIFYPEIQANREEWERSGLHPMDFMAQKCGVELETRKPWLEPGPEALFEATDFLSEHGLTRKGFLTVSHAGPDTQQWLRNNLKKLANAIDLPILMLGEAGEAPVAGTLLCIGRSYRVMAALIRCSAFYIGPASGVSWIAATTNTPMGAFRTHTGFKAAFGGDRDDLVEWDVTTPAETIIDHIAAKVQPMSAGKVAR